MFKIRQKVVYIGVGEYNGKCILPQTNEIVTISGYAEFVNNGYDNYFLKEYPVGKNGVVQSIPSLLLRPLDETFAEGILEQITQQIEEEELILSK